jgi:hypothetical protein
MIKYENHPALPNSLIFMGSHWPGKSCGLSKWNSKHFEKNILCTLSLVSDDTMGWCSHAIAIRTALCSYGLVCALIFPELKPRYSHSSSPCYSKMHVRSIWCQVGDLYSCYQEMLCLLGFKRNDGMCYQVCGSFIQVWRVHHTIFVLVINLRLP